MKENENKELENLIDKAMKNMPLETPSFDFTSRVMAQTAIAPQKVISAYKPILPKSFWLVLSIIIIGLICYAYFSGTPQEEISYGVDIKQIYNSKLNNITSDLNFSKTTMYAAVALLLAMLAQIPIIRNYFQGK
ncbi:hypothetical protein [Flavobacterium microcysteis]|uniref:Uncharacterized protein n=1 Tax=Flavobacterium microcysteis TaxID=2596891 RepID=A0A501QJK0_9FLAO|nr:hypothetical protein [Flavobacterium microcysteis]TPD72257.1 hypothetical protein FJA49_02545 [Flavobacterium microcysteis]